MLNEQRVRPMWCYTLALTVPLIVFIALIVNANRRGTSDFIVDAILLTATLAITANCLRYHYFYITDVAVGGHYYLGLIRRRALVSELTEVKMNVLRNSTFQNVNQIYVCWPTGNIRLSTSLYWPGELRRVVTKLYAAGVPVGDDLLVAMKIPRHRDSLGNAG